MKKEIKPRSGLESLARGKAKDKPANQTKIDHYEHIFWKPLMKKAQTINEGGVEEKVTLDTVAIDYLAFYNFIYSQGFRRFDFNDETVYVQIATDKIIKQVRKIKMLDCVRDFLHTLPTEISAGNIIIPSAMIKDKVLRSIDGLFNDYRLMMELNPREPIIFNKDTLFDKYMYFQNGYLHVTADKREFKEYKTLQHYIWDSQVLKRNYMPPPVDAERDFVRKFFYNVSGKDNARLNDLMIIAGYLIHDFIDYKLQMPLLTDSRISDTDEGANGRTGKGLFTMLVAGALSTNPKDTSIRSFVEILGKDFDPTNKHKWESVGIDTRLIAISDMERDFDIEKLFNAITEGISVNKKNMQPFRLTPKLLGSTNKTVKIEGPSARDRVVEFEFADHYSEDFTPQMEFKCWFFRDWNDEDYCRYYYFMSQCSQKFLANECRMRVPKQINLNARKLIENTGPEFLEFIEHIWKPMPDIKYDKSLYFRQFVNEYQDFLNSKFTQRKFSEWVKLYMKYSGEWDKFDKEKNEARGREDGSTARYFIFTRTVKGPELFDSKT